MSSRYMLWFFSLMVSYVGFYVIEHLFTIPPHKVSGNGNPGLLVIFLLFPFFAASLYLTFILIKAIFSTGLNIKRIAIISSIAILICIILTGLIIHYTNALVHSLGGTPTSPDSRIYRFGWFNQYTNSLYFNTYTFLLIHILSVLAGLLTCIRKPSDL